MKRTTMRRPLLIAAAIVIALGVGLYLSGSWRTVQFARESISQPFGTAKSADVTIAMGLELGQTLIVTAGCGWVQRESGPIEEIRPGDVVWFEPDEKHWHGATLTIAMTHIAIQEALDGKAVDWMEKVGDEEYQCGPAAR
jgi:hypothetical protein